jgi:hypothetical protein
VRAEDGQTGLGRSDQPKTESKMSRRLTWKNPGSRMFGLFRGSIILRSSETIARHTVDMHDMWKGEIIFPNVPVTITK